MNTPAKYFIVEADAMPEIFRKVAEAKRLLETGEETVYATDTQSGQTQSQETHVLLDDGTALAQTVYYPQVCGVAVVCDGGGDVRVAARITELVRALLDISSTRICVEQRRP